MDRKGAAFFIVLAAIFTVILLAGIMLTLMSSHSRLTHHQVSRIQAYYAAMAGVNYALDRLSNGTDSEWPVSGGYTRTMCRGDCNITDPNLPPSVVEVNISVGTAGSCLGGTTCVNATANYTYTP